MHYLILLLAMLSPYLLPAQVGVNLVPNPSFEEYIECPIGGFPTFDSPDQSMAPLHWVNPNYGSPDYHHSCIPRTGYMMGVPQNVWGYQYPRTGNAYVGLTLSCSFGYFPQNIDLGDREYVSVKLNSPTLVGKVYKISMWVSRAGGACYASNGLNMALTLQKLDTAKIMSEPIILPHFSSQLFKFPILEDTLHWHEFTVFWPTDFPAEYLTIGNFNSISSSDFIIQHQDCDTFRTTRNNSYYYIDDIYVSEYDTVIKRNDNCIYLPNAISPNDDSLNDEFVPLFCPQMDYPNYILQIYNRNGQMIFNGNSISWKPQADAPEGVYVYNLKLPNQAAIIGSVTLLR